MEFKENDFIEALEKDSVFRGRLFQIISFGEQRQFGHSLRFARIRNLETKGEFNIEEPRLEKHFRKVEFKNIGSEQKNNDWFLDEVRISKEHPENYEMYFGMSKIAELEENCSEEKKLTPIEATKLALSQEELSETEHLRANCGWIKEIPEDTIKQIALIRMVIRQKCKTLSVRNDRGTAYGWVRISGSKTEWGEFTEEEKKALSELKLGYGLNSAVISPEDRKPYLRKWLDIPQEKREES